MIDGPLYAYKGKFILGKLMMKSCKNHKSC